MTQAELIARIKDHEQYVHDETTGKKMELYNEMIHSLHLSNFNLRFAVMNNTDATLTKYIQSNLSSTELIDCKFSFAEFIMAYIEEMLANGCDFTGANFDRVYMLESNLQESTLDNATFNGATLKNSTFNRSSMNSVKMLRTNATTISLDHVDLNKSNLSYSYFDKASFCHSNLTDVKMKNTVCTNSVFYFSNLTSADLSGCDLSYSSFVGADLTDVNFTGADLTNVDFTGADIKNANFTGAKLICTFIKDVKNLENAINFNHPFIKN